MLILVRKIICASVASHLLCAQSMAWGVEWLHLTLFHRITVDNFCLLYVYIHVSGWLRVSVKRSVLVCVPGRASSCLFNYTYSPLFFLYPLR